MYFNYVRLAFISMVDGKFGMDSSWITFNPRVTFLFPPIAWDSIEK